MQPWNTARRYHFSSLDTLSQVPRVIDPPSDVFNSYFVGQGAPVIFVDSPLFAGPARTLDDIVREDRGKIRVNVRGSDYADLSARQEQQMTLAEYVERYARPLNDGDRDAGVDTLPPYAGNTPLEREDFEALGFRYPECFEGQEFAKPRLWFGPKGSLTPLHFDSQDNLMCQYIGKKHLTLYPPSQIPYLSTRGWAPAWSGVPDPRRPDLDKFPRFAKAKAVEVTLAAGEMLYLPARWSHFVVNIETSLMVNFWPKRTSAAQTRRTFEQGLKQRIPGLVPALRSLRSSLRL